VSSVTLHEGDNRATLRRLIDEGVRVHAVVTDPPYGLTSVVKRFGKEGSAPAKHGTDGAFARASAGFMGKVWDGTGIERDPEFWRLIWEILLPGGFVFAFSGSRTGHWQACAMEMAGFIMHPMHGWVYGSGMPKAHNPCPAIDKHMGVEGSKTLLGETVRRMRPGADQNNDGTWEKLEDREYERGNYVPGSPEAQRWDGWRHGTQTQKPALEPIYLGQKPYSEKTGALNLLKHGVGALNIDGCRVPHQTVNGGNLALNPHLRESINGGNGGNIFPEETERRVVVPHQQGRWPANLMHDGSDNVVALFPAQAGAAAPVKGTEASDATKNAYNDRERVPGAFHADSGSAARFFNSFPDGPDADAIIYHGKATKGDRAGAKHPTVKPVGLIEHLVRHVTPPGGIVLDPFAGSGTTGEAARRLGFDCILMEAEPEYATFLRQRFDLDTSDSFDDLLDTDDFESLLC
jgi:site-specific DNA-methyltransferase (adenine-specific)